MISSSLGDEFDYIIIGAGIGGLVVASRLSEDDTKSILLIEAGPDCAGDPRVEIPGLVTTLYGDDKLDWGFMSEPQLEVNGRQIPQPRGRMLGGSSGLNFSMIMYPSDQDFEAWQKLGNELWSAETMAPYVRKFHRYKPPDQVIIDQLGLDGYLDPSKQGCSGLLPVSFPSTYGIFNRAWNETFARLGWQNSDDPILESKMGGFTCPLSVNPEVSTRGSANAYRIERANLLLLTETRAERIIFASEDKSNGQRIATGVQIAGVGGRKLVSARKEVILCAGSLQSPQLLEISGIGNAELLQKHNIPVIVNLPGVGENLQDHCISSISYKVNDDQVSGDILRDPRVAQSAMELYQKTKTGPMVGMPISVAYLPLVDGCQRASAEDRRHIINAHQSAPTPHNSISLGTQTQNTIISSMLRDSAEAAAEYIFLPLQLHANRGATSMADLFEKKADGNYISILAMLSHPFSRGTVHINSANIDDKPVFDPGYLSHPLDLDILARHTQFIEQIVRTEPFQSLIQPDVRIPDIITSPNLSSNLEVAKCVVKDRLLSCFHPAVTCSMMPVELGGVVNDQLKVHGTSNLRVVDASIFPIEPSGNIQATIYAVAERAADLIQGK
ncbi:aryl-alcohol dehydrogenase [Penicillium nucicola]|uniref:aryl-alcohol dehydrogenase n=1 Tax=Penicillium nucicola TaxID=1850975 RepID=UPI002545A103|nr:aryl-alcohol dehydrogenase [Penicillium nucicola]KAJ5770973.1 aryl-alcohol dehydrogenase [Penicillium nucicola]